MEQEFGRMLRQLRKEQDRTLEDIANAIGVTISYVSDVERGYRPPWANEKVKKVAEYLNVNAGPLLTAAASTRGAFELDPSISPQHREVGASLMRAWGELSAEDLKRIQEEILARYHKE